MTAARMTWVCTELLALWVVLPLLLWTDALPAVYRISVLVAAAVYALWVVRFERVRWDELGFRGLVGFLPSFLQGSLWVAAAVPVLFAAATLLHGEAGSLGRSRPESLLALLLFYAGVSVTSQEFLYSSFFFWRYRPLFSPGFLVGLNAVVFAVAHLVYASLDLHRARPRGSGDHGADLSEAWQLLGSLARPPALRDRCLLRRTRPLLLPIGRLAEGDGHHVNVTRPSH